MVMHNLPSPGKLAEHQREQPPRRLAVGHRQLPRATHKGRVLAQNYDAQAGEFQLPHLVPWTVVGREITFNRCLPSVVLLRSRKKRQLRRIPVALHEALEIVPVPGFLLYAQYVLNGFRIVPIAARHILGKRAITGCEEHDRQTAGRENEKEDKPAATANLLTSCITER